ncbi:hypothetical protein EL22_08315 [Halostagnicola sp. A56]|uniref:hypothetical protein n=1 Tax=Halostagnicola sp. A56 TaxID=1495067 RepID=UPI00049EAD5A|nr:hypothetical protein [Halostagnicola sp. A56]KDE57930.1 hypothetical protein EL22_08315 [Halostagnicola sp. A56]
MYRRSYLRGVAVTGGIVSLAGCTELLGPDPSIENVDGDQSISGAFSGTMDIEVLVENGGRSGDIQITITFEDDEGTVVGRETREITMDSNESRRVTVSVDVPEDADVYTVEADAA